MITDLISALFTMRPRSADFIFQKSVIHFVFGLCSFITALRKDGYLDISISNSFLIVECVNTFSMQSLYLAIAYHHLSHSIIRIDTRLANRISKSCFAIPKSEFENRISHMHCNCFASRKTVALHCACLVCCFSSAFTRAANRFCLSLAKSALKAQKKRGLAHASPLAVRSPISSP